MGSYSRFCQTVRWTVPAVICLTPASGVAVPDLPGVTRPRRPRCDETKPSAGRRAWPTRLAPSRTLAQPVVSPRPLVGSYPTGSPLTRAHQPRAGILSVAVVVRTRFSPACPHLLFRGATRPALHGGRTGSREVPLASACCDQQATIQRRLPHLSTSIIPREQNRFKYPGLICRALSAQDARPI
jgi:hypothetical protein